MAYINATDEDISNNLKVFKASIIIIAPLRDIAK